MHGNCAPPPCPPPDCSEPLGDWGGAGALDALTAAYAEQSTNASGLDDSVPGITIDDSGLGGDGSTITAILEIAGDVVLPATAAAAAATGIIGLAALGKIVSSINRHVQAVKDLDRRLALLAGHAVDLHKDLTREQEKGVNDEWLKEDIAKAEEVLKDVETYCAKLSKQGFMKRYITQSQKRKDRLGVLIARFEAMRANLTTVSVLAMRRFMLDVMGPKMDRIEGNLETVTDALVQVKISQSQSAQASSENLSSAVTSETVTTKTTATTKTKSRTKHSSKSKSRRSKVEEQGEDLDTEVQRRLPVPQSSSKAKVTYEDDSSYRQRTSCQEYHVDPQHYSEVQQDWNEGHGSPWSQYDQFDGQQPDWQPRSDRPYVDNTQYNASYYQSSSDSYNGDNGPYDYGYDQGVDGSVPAIHDQAGRMEEQARRMEEQAHQRACSTEHRPWQTLDAAHHKAHSMRENALRRAEAARGQAMMRPGSNLSLNSWGSETTVYNSVDNSVHNNSSVQYGNVVTTSTYNY